MFRHLSTCFPSLEVSQGLELILCYICLVSSFIPYVHYLQCAVIPAQTAQLSSQLPVFILLPWSTKYALLSLLIPLLLSPQTLLFFKKIRAIRKSLIILHM